MSPLPLYATPGNPELALVLVQHQIGKPVQLVLSPNLRLSGLLKVLPPDLLQVFVALLTFQEGNGEIRVSAQQIAECLGTHPDQAEQRLQLISAYTFDSAPVLFKCGVNLYSLSKRVAVPVDIAPPEAAPRGYQAASKDEVTQRSRERYATPRSEAESIVAEQLGSSPALPIPEGREGDVFRGMIGVGIPEPDVRMLLAEFDLEEVEQQLAWLPERGARNPARFLVAAIRGRYESPESRKGGQQ